MTDLERNPILSPITTPNDDRHLLPCTTKKKEKDQPLYVKYKPPYAVITASILQILYQAVMDDGDIQKLKFDPNRQAEVWRFLSYMLVHENWYHLVLNVAIQCLVAIPLERQQDSVRVGLLYLAGGFLGALGAGSISPDYVIGASAGVYALLISHMADLLLNFKAIKYKKTRCISVGVIVASDVIYNAVHFYNGKAPLISVGAHIFGAIAGLLFGLVLYKTYEKVDKPLSKVLFYIGLISSIATLAILFVISFQIKRCTPVNMIHVKYTYFC